MLDHDHRGGRLGLLDDRNGGRGRFRRRADIADGDRGAGVAAGVDVADLDRAAVRLGGGGAAVAGGRRVAADHHDLVAAGQLLEQAEHAARAFLFLFGRRGDLAQVAEGKVPVAAGGVGDRRAAIGGNIDGGVRSDVATIDGDRRTGVLLLFLNFDFLDRNGLLLLDRSRLLLLLLDHDRLRLARVRGRVRRVGERAAEQAQRQRQLCGRLRQLHVRFLPLSVPAKTRTDGVRLFSSRCAGPFSPTSGTRRRVRDGRRRPRSRCSPRVSDQDEKRGGTESPLTLYRPRNRSSIRRFRQTGCRPYYRKRRGPSSPRKNRPHPALGLRWPRLPRRHRGGEDGYLPCLCMGTRGRAFRFGTIRPALGAFRLTAMGGRARARTPNPPRMGGGNVTGPPRIRLLADGFQYLTNQRQSNRKRAATSRACGWCAGSVDDRSPGVGRRRRRRPAHWGGSTAPIANPGAP
ncbi:MAG: hypothetical protein AVDCRST_MAG19-1224 [uncultured Thermomicrobiales bacterium]|uniref:Uncharacterized protein n=1 Tax=uncultured Thermomicrobiales bacterium TaxID=1645740 RepID=A0A6J4UPB9_9BACT|nr:MAG: hypothetical protein AVDCRST_MAG19-1224 [uncultured Thermomicrobiales bacterium]